MLKYFLDIIELAICSVPIVFLGNFIFSLIMFNCSIINEIIRVNEDEGKIIGSDFFQFGRGQ